MSTLTTDLRGNINDFGHATRITDSDGGCSSWQMLLRNGIPVQPQSCEPIQPNPKDTK